jgi:predicted ester cyclase
VAYIAIYRLENGKVVENWVQMDMLSMMQQLGVIPQPEQAGV